MHETIQAALPRFIETLGLDAEPMGIFYTDKAPEAGFSPPPLELPTREKEARNAIDWPAIFDKFSCALGNIWRARRKQTAAYFDASRFGCPGAAFWLGYMKPQTETIIHYVSSGVPDRMSGERYCESPDTLRRIFEQIDPPAAPEPVCVVKPLSRFEAEESPELVAFFARTEPLCGLSQLAFFVTNDPQVVVSPWGAACTGLITWPRKYLLAGETKAVLGGFDISGRKFFGPDELSFTVPFSLFETMLNRYEQSFLGQGAWETVKKKIARSRRAWGKQRSNR